MAEKVVYKFCYNYNSDIFDNLYRVWGDEDTIVAAYVGDKLRTFKTKTPYSIISKLIKEGNIYALCNNYDWTEITL